MTGKRLSLEYSLYQMFNNVLIQVDISFDTLAAAATASFGSHTSLEEERAKPMSMQAVSSNVYNLKTPELNVMSER